jgi:hypothetical protein
MLVTQIFTGSLFWDKDKAPDIMICNNSGASVYRVKKAVSYWQSLGYSFGSVYKVSRDNISCITGIPLYSTIMIDIPSQGFNFGKHLGTTKTWWLTNSGEILKAKIEIQPGWELSERVIEHEIGHALGFKDNSIVGHMMNGAWIKGGYKKKGLQRPETN